MQNTALNTIFTESYIKDVEAGLEHLSKVCIESCAATAYNDVLFEAALSDDVLREADEEKKDEKKNSKLAGVKNVAFKAIQTLKMVFQTVFNKIKVVINEFIKNEVEKGTAKAYDKLAKDAKALGNDVYVKYTDKVLGVSKTFVTDIKYMDLVTAEDEEKMVAELVKNITGLGSNYKKADEALKNAKSVNAVNKVLNSMISYCDAKEVEVPVSGVISNKEADMMVVSKSVKEQYTKSVADIKNFISTKEKELKGSSDEDAAKIKKEVILAQKLISYEHAAYIGQLKYTVAMNKDKIAAIKSALKGGVKQEAFTEFMGLQLL